MQDLVNFLNRSLENALERIQVLENTELVNRDQELDDLKKYISTIEQNNQDLLKAQNEQKKMYD